MQNLFSTITNCSIPNIRADMSPSYLTNEIQKTIDSLSQSGGGYVVIPPGVWTVSTIFLRSNIELILPYNTVLQPDPNLTHYPLLPRDNTNQKYHLIFAEDCINISISGNGIIDGKGEIFWEEPLRDLKAKGINISEDIKCAPSHWPIDGPFWRGWKDRITPLIEFRYCKNVRLKNITVKNSPGWTIHPFCCSDVLIKNVTIDNHMYGPNTDGIDINGCHDVIISGCKITGCDDNIILKATVDARSCERVVVENCILKTNCAALGIGAECSSDIRDVTFTNCTVEQSLRMIQFEMWTGGIIENVIISNISGNNMTPPDIPMEKVIYMDIQQHKQKEPVKLGKIRNVIICGITAKTQGRCILTAQNGTFIEDVVLRDIIMEYPSVEDSQLLAKICKCSQNSNFNPDAQAANAVFVAENVRKLYVENMVSKLPPPPPEIYKAWLRNVTGRIVAPLLKGNGRKKDVVILENSDFIHLQ